MHNQQGWPQAWEYCQAKLIQTLGRASQEWTEAGVSASRVITLRHLQEKGYQATSETEHRQKHLTWAKEKKNWTVAQWYKVYFSDESQFCISFGNQGPESGGRVERHRIHVALRSSVKFPQSVMIWAAMSSAGVGPLCFLKSTVNAAIYQEILEHFMLPSADKLYGDADFIFQQDLAPAHTAKGTKSWFNDHGVTVLDWPANSPDLNPIKNLWGIVKRKMRDTRPNNADDLKATIKGTWASLHLSSATGWLSLCHTALMQLFMQKEYWVLSA